MKKVVVIGGGFAGTKVAKKLKKDFAVTLIDTKDYFEYTPGVLRTIVEPQHVKKLQAMHKDYLPEAEIILDCVEEVGEDYVQIRNGKKKIKFDYLAICSGSSYALPIKEQEVLLGGRVDHLKKANEELMEGNKILIIGGGIVGVELAAEICTHARDKKVILMHSRDELIPRNNPKTQKYVKKFLRDKGVGLVLGERMKSVKDGVCVCESGKKIKADVIFLTVGIVPNYKFMEKYFSRFLSDGGQIKVDEKLRVLGSKNIFAAGDVTAVDEEKTAQNAEHHAAAIIRNIKASEGNGNMTSYKVKKTPIVMSLGKYDGVIEYGKFVQGGKLAALMKWGIEKWIMWSYR